MRVCVCVREREREPRNGCILCHIPTTAICVSAIAKPDGHHSTPTPHTLISHPFYATSDLSCFASFWLLSFFANGNNSPAVLWVLLLSPFSCQTTGFCGSCKRVQPPKAFLFSRCCFIVQELCESRGGRPGLSVLTNLLVSVDVKL